MGKELDNYTLEEIENVEQLKLDCKKTENIAMKYIKSDAIKRLEELRLEFIITNHIHREKQAFVNQVFAFLKERA